jgi:hypothetical protein
VPNNHKNAVDIIVELAENYSVDMLSTASESIAASLNSKHELACQAIYFLRAGSFERYKTSAKPNSLDMPVQTTHSQKFYNNNNGACYNVGQLYLYGLIYNCKTIVINLIPFILHNSQDCVFKKLHFV